MFSSSCNNVSSLFPQFCNPNNDTMNNGNDYNNHNSMLVFDSSSSSSNQIPLTVSFWPTNGYNCEVPILNDTQQHHHHQQQQPQANQNALNENENALPVFRQPKGPVKRKDRHSKISTAQGVRDRRVRLSIEIARKFFDLQDLLGFDRASKTLEWLLLKSKKAIKELSTHSNNEDDNNTNKKQSLCSSNSSCDQADQDHLVVSNNKLDSKREKRLEKIPLVAKQSRAKARARARERTKMKMSIRALHDQFKKTCSVPTLIPILNHSRSADLKVQMEENGANTSCYNHHQVMEQQQQHTTTTASEQQQSLEMKKKLKSHLMIGYHQNLVSSSQPQNLSQNWEITNQISRSSFWTITNMNLSSAGPQVQVNGRSWKDL